MPEVLTKPEQSLSDRFEIRGDCIVLGADLARDVHRVADAMTADARAGVVELGPNQLRVAENTSSTLRTAGLAQLQGVGMPLTSLVEVAAGAEEIVEGYKRRREQYFEDKSIPENPETLRERFRKVRASAVAAGMVAVGKCSSSGRSAKRLLKKIDPKTRAELEEEARLRKRSPRTHVVGTLNEWFFKDEPQQHANGPAVTY